MSHKVDAIILATGDGDFIPLVEYLKSQGCQVEGVTFGRSASGRFKEVVDDFIDMDEDPNTFLIGYRATRGKNGKGTSRKNASKKATGLKKQINKVVGTDTDDM